MKKFRFLISAVTMSAMLTPMMAAAGSAGTATMADEFSEEDILDIIEQPVPAMDGRESGGGGTSANLIYPGPYGGGVTVDAMYTQEVTPDFVGINAYCDSGEQASRQAVRDVLNTLYTDIKNIVGRDGRVRKSGSVSVYPFYGSDGRTTDGYSGNLNVFIRVSNIAATERIYDAIEEKNCSVNWDVRLMDAQEYELDILDTLTTRLNNRKKVFEKLLGKRLTNVNGASLNTWADGYSTYDPETNKVEATTTLSVTFDLGGRATLTPATPATRSAPRG